jgi:pimeloyl-ACP methyl ester carboxylesterase
LLLHGLAGSQRYFGAAFDALAEQGRLVAPDLLGFGSSAHRGGEDYGPDAHASAVHDTLEGLDVEAPVVVGAHSIGALVAFRLARRWPERVRGVVAFGPPLYGTPEQARAHIGRLGPWVRIFAMDSVWARWACAWMCRHREPAARVAQWLRPDLPAEIARDGVAHDWHSYSGSLRELVLAAQARQDLEQLEIPVRLIAGESDRVVDVDLLRELAASRENATLERWPGDHDLPLVDPERCVDALRTLAREVEGGRT